MFGIEIAPAPLDSNKLMRLTVLSVAYPLTTVGPDAAGGSEQIVTLLDRALTEAGHRSLVLAAEDSQVAGTLIPSPKGRAILDDDQREWGRRVHRQLLNQALTKYQVDLVHMHSLDFHAYVPAKQVPVLATLHLPPDWYPGHIFTSTRRDYHLNCVSLTQHRACPASPVLTAPIPNGVEVARLCGPSTKRRYALALGRICPEKGFHLALKAARMARVKLLLAGQIFPYESHQAYFQKKILPRLDNHRRFIGPVGFSRKKKLLAGAKCLLIPSTVAETSSLVAMEALAAGTPVIAFRSGALPEIVEHGKTGYIVSDAKEMAEAIPFAEQLSSEICKGVARSRFWPK